jgi:peptide chain release factor 1
LALRDLLADAVARAAAVERELLDPKTVRDSRLMASLGREHQRLTQVVERSTRLLQLDKELSGAREMAASAADAEERELAEAELEQLASQIARLEEELKPLLLPRDPLDDRNCIVEIRAGTGGDEAGLFAADLWRMYTRHIERLGWRVELMGLSEGTLGGVKEVIFKVIGTGAFGEMRWESGVHRVQRVPATEAQGRIHTSAATVAVLPEAEEIDIKVEDKDIRIDVFRSSGPGGQSVNTTDSAVRITHLPSGLVVSQQDQKSQLQNKLKAMEVLRARLLDLKLAEQEAERSRLRRSQVSTGDRSAKIRTYNFPQSRVTDHRIGFTTHNLAAVMNGDIGPLIEAMKLADVEEKLAGTTGAD